MKKKFLLFIIFLSFFFVLNVYASSSVNLDSTYDITINDTDVDLSSYVDSSQTTTIEDFINNIVSLHSDNYRVVVVLDQNSSLKNFHINVVPNSITSQDVYLVGRNSTYSNSIFDMQTNSGSYQSQIFTIPTNQSNIYNTTQYQNFYNCYINNSCNLINVSSFGNYLTINYSRTNVFNNNNNFPITYPTTGQRKILLYSDVDFLLNYSDFNNYTCNQSTSSCFIKKVYINENLYNNGSKLPSYYDLFLRPQISFNNYDQQLNRVFVGNIPKNNINSLNIDLSFNVNDSQYINNIDIKTNFFGRVDHSSYYSYEKINCSADTIISSFAIDGNLVTGKIFPYGVVCSSDLSSYDQIFTRVDILPNGSVDYVTYNLSLSSNYGNVFNFSTINQSFSYYNKLYIYEKFDNLDPHFSLMLSTNKDTGYSYYLSDSIYTIGNYISLTTKEIMYNYQSFGSMSNTMYNIYNYYDYNQNNTNLKLFIDNDSIISVGSNNTYTYYDENRDLVSGIINNNFIYSLDTNSYDLSYYFNVINSYIDSISNDIYDFSVVVQNCYNLIPTPFDLMLLILFILGCMHMLFKLIKR